MARFDVYDNQRGKGYLLDVQTDLLSGFNTRVVVPLIPRDVSPTPARGLNPIFVIEGEAVVMSTQYLASVPENDLRHCVVNLQDHHQLISGALDMLFVGF